MKLRHHAKHLVRGVLLGALIAVLVIGGALCLFLAFFGTARFLADFWPVDDSRVGPNLVASIVLTVLLIGHNEYRAAVRGVESGERFRQVAKDLEREVLHPAEQAEQHIAADVVDETATLQPKPPKEP